MGLFSRFHKPKSLKDLGYLKGKTDRHSHILYGVDDGISTLEESLSALKREEELGVAEVWCTPHVMEDVPNTSEYEASRSARDKRFCCPAAAWT